MQDFIQGVAAGWTAMSWLELIAVLLAIGYLLLAVRENIWCWACAFGSTAIYVVLFYDVALLQESLLNAYYLAMAVYGWRQWRQGNETLGGRSIVSWRFSHHLAVIAVTSIIALVAGALFDRYTGADWPYLDSFTTWFAIVTTWMVARKVLENWLYWFVIDSASIFLYVQKGLYLTALLFVAYLVIIVFGYRRWLASWRSERSIA